MHNVHASSDLDAIRPAIHRRFSLVGPQCFYITLVLCIGQKRQSVAFCSRFAHVLLAFCSRFARILLAFCSRFAHKPYQNAKPTHSVMALKVRIFLKIVFFFFLPKVSGKGMFLKRENADVFSLTEPSAGTVVYPLGRIPWDVC